MINYTFKRVEVKFLLTKEQYENIKDELFEHVKIDEYGMSTIQSLYYDTKNDLLVRRSIEKPEFKEKLRLRSYGLAKMDSKLYLEIKRKYDGIVYKRRIGVTQAEANLYVKGNIIPDSQIGKEIIYMKKFYKDLEPKMLLIYDRCAYKEAGSDLRITIDENIRYRKNNLDLTYSLDGNKLFDEDYYLMEIKTAYAFPLWLTKLLSKNKIYKSSFSKYGKAYLKEKENEDKEILTWKNYSDQFLAVVQ